MPSPAAAISRPKRCARSATRFAEKNSPVREMMPLGWGDTYFQNVAGQSFDITHVPNGTYYIEVRTDPARRLYERDTSNDVVLRRIRLGGNPGARTVTVPPYHGIDSEGSIMAA